MGYRNANEKNIALLKRIQDRVGGDLRISKSGTPHLVIDEYFSVVRFSSTKKFRVFKGYMTSNNRKLANFDNFNEVIRFMNSINRHPYNDGVDTGLEV